VVKHNDVAVQGTLLGPVNRSKCIWHFLKVMQYANPFKELLV
jgi:hypothetical protein